MGERISHVYLVVYGTVSHSEPAIAIDAEAEQSLSRVLVGEDNIALFQNLALAAQSDEEATALFESDIDRALQLSLAETGRSYSSHDSVSRWDENPFLLVETEINSSSRPALENVADIVAADSSRICNLRNANEVEESEADTNVFTPRPPATCGGHQISFTSQNETVASSQFIPGRRKCLARPMSYTKERKAQFIEAVNSIKSSSFPEDNTDEEHRNKKNDSESRVDFGKRKSQATFTFGDCNEGEEQESVANISKDIRNPCVPLRKKKKKPDSATFTCADCPSSRQNKKKDESSDEEESASNFASSVSSQEEDEDLDVLTIGLEAGMTWKTLEDLELDRIERLAQHLREDPLCPPPLSFGAELLKQEGLNLPLVHCAFKGCSWISDARPCLRVATQEKSFRIVTEEGLWTKLACRNQREDGIFGCCGDKSCLKQHIVDDHSAPLIDTCGMEYEAHL